MTYINNVIGTIKDFLLENNNGERELSRVDVIQTGIVLVTSSLVLLFFMLAISDTILSKSSSVLSVWVIGFLSVVVILANYFVITALKERKKELVKRRLIFNQILLGIRGVSEGDIFDEDSLGLYIIEMGIGSGVHSLYNEIIKDVESKSMERNIEVATMGTAQEKINEIKEQMEKIKEKVSSERKQNKA